VLAGIGGIPKTCVDHKTDLFHPGFLVNNFVASLIACGLCGVGVDEL
jgi:hypothetical protein